MSQTEEKKVTVHSEPQPVVFNEISGFKNFRNEPVTVEEAIEASGSNFEVQKQHIIRVNDADWNNMVNGDFSTLTLSRANLIQSHCCTTRADNGRNLGIVGKDYGVVQNRKAFDFVNFILDGMAGGEGNKAIITSCGVIGGGSKMFVSAKMPGVMKLGDSDVDDYILFVNSHDGSFSVQVMFTPIRVVCQNTLNMAMSTAKNKLTFKHTSCVNDRLELTKNENLERAIEVLNMHETFKAEFIDKLSDMASQQVSDLDVKKFAANMVLTPAQVTLLQQNDWVIEGIDEISSKSKNNVRQLTASIESGVGQNINRGSKLWLINGLTTHLSNEKRWKTGEDKFSSIFGGTASRQLQKAYEFVDAL